MVTRIKFFSEAAIKGLIYPEGDETLVPWGSRDDRAVDRDTTAAIVFASGVPSDFIYGRVPPILPQDVKPGLQHFLKFAGGAGEDPTIIGKTNQGEVQRVVDSMSPIAGFGKVHEFRGR